MATVDKEKTAAEATALFDQGIAKIKANEMDNAIELLGKCLELRTAAFGENAIETAQAYHKYGCALFYKAQDENTVFGARAQEAADAKNEADAAANDASDEGEDVGDDDDADDASAENADAPATDFVIELPAEMADVEGSPDSGGADPVDFLPEATDIKWQHFARAWNSIVADLRARDHLSDAERDDLSYTFLVGRDVEQIFDAPEYVVLPPMLSSSRCSPPLDALLLPRPGERGER